MMKRYSKLKHSLEKIMKSTDIVYKKSNCCNRRTLILLRSVTLALIAISIPTVIGTTEQSNFFRVNDMTYNYNALNNEAWGFYCYNKSVYVPTCGWKLILTSSMRLDYLGVWDCELVQQDSYTFILSDLGYNADFSTKVPPCSSVTLRGPFGGEENKPDIYINFYCVCTPISSGTCKSVPYNTIQPLSAGTNSPTRVVTEQSTAPATDLPSTALHPGQLMSNPTQVLLSRDQDHFCYLGTSQTTLNKVSKMMCCSYCLNQDRCVGINYKEDNECDLVHETFQIAPLAYGYDSNCQYWGVRWKK